MECIRLRTPVGGARAAACAFALFTFLGSAWPAAEACAQAADEHAVSAVERGVDPAVKPGDDFFAYANGAWLKATTIPEGKERWGPRNELEALTHRQVLTIFDAATTAPAGSIARKIADYRAAYLNQAAIDAKGLAPLKPLLDSIDRIQDKIGLTQMLGRGMVSDADPLNYGVFQSSHILGLSVEAGIAGESTYPAFLIQGGLGLPDREYYVRSDSQMQALRKQYRGYISQMLALAQFDHPDQRADAVLVLETAIAVTQATREASANDHNGDTLWTRADFARQAPGMDWSVFFAAAGLPRQESFVPWQPSAVRGVAALVNSASLDAWKDYLRVRALDENADVLPRAFADLALSMHGAAFGHLQPAPREERALEETQLALSEAIGHLYADRYFPARQKTRLQGVVANVVAAFSHRVEALTWMSPATRRLALVKLKRLYVGIAYPEQWQDYADLKIDPQDALGNLRRVADRNYRRALAHLGRPIDTKEWFIAPQTVGATLFFQLNSYEFAAALLQVPKFDSTASDAAVYGSVGAIIGHDVTHYIDILGAEYDTTGRERRWFNAEDMVGLAAMEAPLDEQFSGYHPFPDLAVNGKLTGRENVADLGGLEAAFEAYRGALGGKSADKASVRRQDREFFLAFAQSYRVRLTENGLRNQLATNDHAPETYRVATVRNMDAWYDAFDVRPGDRLYLEPKARVKVW